MTGGITDINIYIASINLPIRRQTDATRKVIIIIIIIMIIVMMMMMMMMISILIPLIFSTSESKCVVKNKLY